MDAICGNSILASHQYVRSSIMNRVAPGYETGLCWISFPGIPGKIISPSFSRGCSSESAEKRVVCSLNPTTASNSNIFGSLSEHLVIREAMPVEYWEIAHLHTASFFPGVDSAMGALLKTDRVIALLSNLGMPAGRNKTCLVAIERFSSDSQADDYFNSEEMIPGGPIIRPLVASFQIGLPDFTTTKSEINVGANGIVGTVTVDNVGEFLLRRDNGRRRRRLTAYVSNMAVRISRRRRGVAKQLLDGAERIARDWECRTVALHCDLTNVSALELYKSQGYRIVVEPTGSKWPRPWAGPEVHLALMMKTLVTK